MPIFKLKWTICYCSNQWFLIYQKNQRKFCVCQVISCDTFCSLVKNKLDDCNVVLYLFSGGQPSSQEITLVAQSVHLWEYTYGLFMRRGHWLNLWAWQRWIQDMALLVEHTEWPAFRATLQFWKDTTLNIQEITCSSVFLTSKLYEEKTLT